MELKLRLLAKRLKEKANNMYFPDDTIDRKVAEGKQEVYIDIADLIEECLNESNKNAVDELGTENL